MLQVSRWTPFASVLLVSLICGGVVANNSAMMWMGGNTAASPSGVVSLPARILLSVILVSTIVRMKWTTAHHDAHYLIPSQMFALLPSRLIRWASRWDTLCRNTRSASRNGPHARYPSKRGCRTRHWRWSWPRAWAPTLSRTCRVR